MNSAVYIVIKEHEKTNIKEYIAVCDTESTAEYVIERLNSNTKYTILEVFPFTWKDIPH